MIGAVFAADKSLVDLTAKVKSSKYIQNVDGKFTYEASIDKETKYIAYYFSAHWCPPCRKFTPLLAEFYKENFGKTTHSFDIAFVSSDRNTSAMKKYMKEGKMGFKGVKHRSSLAKALDEKYAARYIPFLVIVDSEGNVVSKSKHASEVLDELKKLVK